MLPPVIDTFKGFYRDLANAELSQLDALYSEDIIFRDPIHSVSGLVAVQDYMAAVCSDVSHCQFEYLDELVGDKQAYIKWNMHFKHPKLGGKLVTVRGVTQLNYRDKIYYHEDFYDMGAMLYEQLPLIGPTTRWLKRRLQSS